MNEEIIKAIFQSGIAEGKKLAANREWSYLTDGEIYDLKINNISLDYLDSVAFARAIETLIKEKNSV